MPFSGTTYTNVSGATNAVAGGVVQSAVWNNIHTDLASALTQVMQQLVSNITNKNALFMNGGFEVWQRGAGNSANIALAASNTAYMADRWYLTTGANQASHVSAQAGLTNGSVLCAQVIRDSGQTGTTAMTFGYPLDTDEITRLRGNKVSFTAVVKAGANWSPTSGTLTVAFFTGTGVVGKRGGGFTNETSVLSIATNLTAGGSNTTISGSSTVVVPTTATQAELQFTWTPTGTAGANDFFQVDDVQLESQLSAGTWTPNNFDRIPFAESLQYCQRHFFKSLPYGIAVAQGATVAGSIELMAAVPNVSVGQSYQFPVRLRATASITTFNPSGASANWQNLTSGVSVTAAIDPNTAVSDAVVFITGVSVSAQGQNIAIQVTGSAGI